MLKKFLSLLLIVLSLAGCAKEPVKVSSIISSETASSEIASSEIDHSAWGSSDDITGIIRPTFMSKDSDDNIFYCSATGDIYKKLADGKGLSKVYSSSGYKFFSVQCTNKDEICAGYKKGEKEYGFIIFNLKDKTVRNAVNDSEFKGKDINSLVFYNGSYYFLANPDRYNRYTLYMQKDSKTTEIANGVNEFFILRERVFYNIGSYIFSASLDASNKKLITDLPSNDFIGFSIFNEQIMYMTSTDTYIYSQYSSQPVKIQPEIKVYTSTRNSDNIFFCGVNGGIYALSKIHGSVSKILDYTAGSIYADEEFLYLFPANQDEYKNIPKDLLISGGIYRVSISELLEYNEYTEDHDITSSSLSDSEGASSQITDIEIPPPTLELFGR